MFKRVAELFSISFHISMADFEGEWDIGSPVREEEESDGQPIVASPRKKRMRSTHGADVTPKRKQVRKDGKVKAKPRAKEEAKICHVQGCDVKAKPKNKSCNHHFNILGCLHTQAKKSGNLETYQQILACPVKTREACDAFDNENPPSSGMRKNLVEWGQWRKRFGVRAATVQRQGEELMSMTEYLALEEAKGISRSEAEEAWQQLLDKGAEGEGEAKTRKLWIEENKKIYREKSHYEDAGWDEGGSLKKNFSSDERDKMKTWAQDSSTFGSSFLLKSNAASASSGAGSVSATVAQMEAQAKSSASVQVGLEAPALHKSLTKDLKVLKAAYETAKLANESAQTAFNDLQAISPPTTEMTAYHDLVVCRLFLADYVEADEPLSITPPTSLITFSLPAVPPSVGGSRGGPSRSQPELWGDNKRKTSCCSGSDGANGVAIP